MDCSECDLQMEKLRQGRLTPEEHLALESHLSSCPACSGLPGAAGDYPESPEHELPDDLTNAILERTSGPACGCARERLCDFVDGRLESNYVEIMSLHLAHCSECAALAAALAEAQQVLPQMCELDPGAGFTSRVLRETSRLRYAPPAVPRSGIRQWWQRLIQRPRFSWEAAYLGTLLLVTLFGNPFTAIRELTLRSAFLHESRGSFSWSSLALPGSLLKGDVGVVKCARDFGEAISTGQQRALRSAIGMVHFGTESARSRIGSDFKAAQMLMQRATSAIKKKWAAFHSPRSGQAPS